MVGFPQPLNFPSKINNYTTETAHSDSITNIHPRGNILTTRRQRYYEN
jgi:hypothetical protein